MVEVGHADVHVAVCVMGDRMPDQHVLHVLPCRRQQLHDTLRSDVRDDAVVVAGLHPGKRTREAAIDAVVSRPAVERIADADRVRRRHGGGCRTCGRRDAQLHTDEKRMRRIEMVGLRNRRQRQAVFPRNRGERVARLHDIARERRLDRDTCFTGTRVCSPSAANVPGRRRRRQQGASRAGTASTRRRSACPCTR